LPEIRSNKYLTGLLETETVMS